MQSINAGFQNLKALIPHSSGEKLSKACILQRSADYMQYLSNEKDKITNKLQIAIRLIESNGLLAQLQTQINMSLAESNSNNQSNSTSTTTSAAAAKANRLQQKQHMAALASASTDTSCSSQNQSTDANTNEKSSTKIATISATPASVASNRKSISSSVSFYASPDRNDVKLEQQQQTLPPQTPSIPLPPLETTSPSSLTNITSNPLSSIINLKGKNINNTNLQIEPIKINTTSPNFTTTNNNNNKLADTTYLTSIDNDQNKFTIKSNLLSGGDDLSSNTTTLNEKNNTPTILTSSPNTNLICRQLSDTTNIISFSDTNNLIVLNGNNNSNNTLNANSNVINNMQVTNLSQQQHGNSQLQLNLNPNETTSCSFNTSTTTNGSDLKGNNNSNLFSCGPTLIQSLNPIGALTSLQQHSQILSSSSSPNNNEQNNSVVTNASTIMNNINSKQIQLEFDNSKKISNLLRCTDLLASSSSSSSLSSSLGGNNLNKKHIKQMVQMEQPSLIAQPLSNQINQVTEQDLQQMGMSHIQISNVDLVKLIEYKVKNPLKLFFFILHFL
jgi:hypothetical protein